MCDYCKGPCKNKPCLAVEGAIGDSCKVINANTFACDCLAGLGWSKVSIKCQPGKHMSR